MEAHEALERFEKVVESQEESDGKEGKLARAAAVVVAVLAAFLAIATYLGNQATTGVITDETKSADTQAQFDANDIKTIIASSDAVLLRVVGTGNPKEATAVAKAEELESRVQHELTPTEQRLSAKITTDETDRTQAEQRHKRYAVSEVALQVAIVLAGISILARRYWLLWCGVLLGAGGVAFLIAGLAY
ncbi:MAG TPA: DUF4337 family protein [Solirubrobacteraceae bacterium]|nr:DUF4337 family protein [Solirubrobacteraceae bacterium]